MMEKNRYSISITTANIGGKEMNLGENIIELAIIESMQLFKLKGQKGGNVSILFSNLKSANLYGLARSGKLSLNLIDEIDLVKVGLSKTAINGIIEFHFINLEEKSFFEFSKSFLKHFDKDPKSFDVDINNTETNNFIRSVSKNTKFGSFTKNVSTDEKFVIHEDETRIVKSVTKGKLLTPINLDVGNKNWFKDAEIEYGFK